MPSPRWIAALMLIALAIFYVRSGGSVDRAAFAGAIEGVDSPEALTWTRTFYPLATTKDGTKSWYQPERRLYAYRRPGLYRETFLDAEGRPRMVEIKDILAGKMLVLDMAKKTAVLKAPYDSPDARGPFAWVGDALRDRMIAKSYRVKSVSLLGTKEIDGARANVVRITTAEGAEQGGDGRQDLYFDAATKRLAAIWSPNDRSLDLETVRSSTPPPGEKAWSHLGAGSLAHEIVVDAKVDAADFSLDPPAGYAFESLANPTITEAEMIGYLGAAARLGDGAFPDSPFGANPARRRAASEKAEADRTPAEAEYLRLTETYMLREIYRSPVLKFIEDHAAPGSFQYVGAGTKLGDPARIVCWYTPRGTDARRAVFADLSVRDVDPSELPLELPR